MVSFPHSIFDTLEALDQLPQQFGQNTERKKQDSYHQEQNDQIEKRPEALQEHVAVVERYAAGNKSKPQKNESPTAEKGHRVGRWAF